MQDCQMFCSWQKSMAHGLSSVKWNENRYITVFWRSNLLTPFFALVKKNIYRLDESSPKSIFEYYSYGLDTETLRRFCKDISEQAPEKKYSMFSSGGNNLLTSLSPKSEIEGIVSGGNNQYNMLSSISTEPSQIVL